MIQTAGSDFGFTANQVIRSGYGDFSDNTGDWTILIRFKYPSTPGAGRYAAVLNLFDGATDYTDPYLFIGSAVATGDVYLEIFDGTNFDTSTAQAIINNDQNWAAAVKSGNSVTLYVNGVAIGSPLTVAISSVVWDSLFLLGDGTGANTAPLSVAYCRAWSIVKSIPDLILEAASITAVSATSLLWDNPFQASIDLTSHNNTLNQLVATGTVTTDTTDPLLSVVAAPPTNIDPSTAIEVTVDSAYFQDVLVGGFAAPEVWHKLTATRSEFWGACGFGDLAVYKPIITVYEGLANANSATKYLDIQGGILSPIQFPVTAGNTYYFRSIRTGAVTPAILKVSILKSLELPVPIGSIAINDDAEGQSDTLALLDVNTGYPIRYVNNFTTQGDGGCPLTDGTTLVCLDSTSSKPKIYNSALAVIATLDLQFYDRVSSNLIDTFLIGLGSLGHTGHIFRLCNALGVLNSTIFDTGSGIIQSVGINNNATLAYYVDSSSANQPVKSWDLSLNVAGANLVAGIANYSSNRDIIVLQDGLIVVPRVKTTVVRDYLIRIYNAAGVQQHSYSQGVNGHIDNRLATAIDDPNSFWSWEKVVSPSGNSVFNNVKVSDGSVLNTCLGVQYEHGVYQADIINTPIRFGHSESCPFWITRVALFPVAVVSSGLYTVSGTGAIDPAKVISGEGTGTALIRHDQNWIDTSLGTSENVKIPDPYYDTFLAGDE